jgi:diguanylate cyclase (GGDEF)-like protein
MGFRPATMRQPTQPASTVSRSGCRGVLFIDLDGLKAIKDTLGHAAGDSVLVHIAQAIRAQVRHGDLVARFSGDEFVASLFGLHSATDAEAIAAEIHSAVGEPIETMGHVLIPSVSIGVAVARAGEAVEYLLATTPQGHVRGQARTVRR